MLVSNIDRVGIDVVLYQKHINLSAAARYFQELLLSKE
jgi:hypothetical protein